MAHIGQKFALGPVGRLGVVARGGEPFCIVFQFGDVGYDTDVTAARRRPIVQFEPPPARVLALVTAAFAARGHAFLDPGLELLSLQRELPPAHRRKNFADMHADPQRRAVRGHDLFVTGVPRQQAVVGFKNSQAARHDLNRFANLVE